MSNLSETDKAKLESCVEGVKAALGDTVSRQQMVDAVIAHNFNTEAAVNYLLDSSEAQQPAAKKGEHKFDVSLS